MLYMDIAIPVIGFTLLWLEHRDIQAGAVRNSNATAKIRN